MYDMTEKVCADILIESASASDLPAISELLDRCGLPGEGIGGYVRTALVARVGREIIGSVALETFGDIALLRSVAVDTSYREKGLGRRLVRTALDLARHHHISRLFLLTDTAVGFFSKFGFRPIPESRVPSCVKSSTVFQFLYPEKTILMERHLDQN